METFPHKGINGISSILILSHNIEFHLWWLYPDEISNIVQSLWIQTLSRYFLTPKSSPKNFLLGSIGNGLPWWPPVTGSPSSIGSSFYWLIDMPLHFLFGIEIGGAAELRPSKLARRNCDNWGGTITMMLPCHSRKASLLRLQVKPTWQGELGSKRVN